MIKKLPVLFSFLLLLSACNRETPSASNYDPHAMPGMPCHQMGGVYMGDCEVDENGNVIPPNQTPNSTPQNSDETFSQDTENLPEAKSSEIVELKEGDRYEMTAMMVKQEIGNKTIKRLAYNGQIPGPLLKVPQNAQVTLIFKNNLEIETTLHPHGLRLDNAFDGTPDLTQKAIKPGETFEYQLKFPDAGIYWYHPHIREDYAQELGLYGNFLVHPEDKTYWNPVNKEEVLMVDDLLINEQQPQFNKAYTDHSLMGRYGNLLLINNEPNYSLSVKKGEIVRFYITNTANTRPFNLKIEGVPMKLVGGDIGRIEKETMVESLLLGPAERGVIEAQFNQAGTFKLVHQTSNKTYTLGEIKVEGEGKPAGNFKTLSTHPQDYVILRKDWEKLLQKKSDKSLRLSIAMDGMDNMPMTNMHGHRNTGLEWEDTMPMMNQRSTSQNTTWKLIDETTGKENMDINWSFNQGDLVKIKIYNDPQSMHPMQHPIHFHGQRFVVLTRDGKPTDTLQWKDTTLINNGETVELLVEMFNPGKWMAHCHIAEHLHSGMMLHFEVK